MQIIDGLQQLHNHVENNGKKCTMFETLFSINSKKSLTTSKVMIKHEIFLKYYSQ